MAHNSSWSPKSCVYSRGLSRRHSRERLSKSRVHSVSLDADEFPTATDAVEATSAVAPSATYASNPAAAVKWSDTSSLDGLICYTSLSTASRLRTSTSTSTASADSSITTSTTATGCSPRANQAPSSPIGPKFKLTREFDAAVCRLNQHKTLVSKILSSRFLRRWENHSVRLGPHAIDSVQSTGFMSESIAYESISEVYATKRWDPHHKFCLRITLADGTSALFQAPSSYLRDQWLHSILWSKQISRFSQDSVNNRDLDFGVILRNMKTMVDLSLTTPLQDTSIYQTTLDILCGYLHNIDNANSDDLGGCYGNQVIAVMTPLLERCTPTQPICEYLCKLCDSDLPLVTGQLAPVIERIIKRNTDFGKYPGSRRLVETYLKALSRLEKHSRRALGQSPRKRARSRSAERCHDLNPLGGHFDHARSGGGGGGHKSGSSLSVMTASGGYRPSTIDEQCGAEQGYQATSSLSVFHACGVEAEEHPAETAASTAQSPSWSLSKQQQQQQAEGGRHPTDSAGTSSLLSRTTGTSATFTDDPLDDDDAQNNRVIAVNSTGSIINVQFVSDTDVEDVDVIGVGGGAPTTTTATTPTTTLLSTEDIMATHGHVVSDRQRLEVPSTLEDEVFRCDEAAAAATIQSPPLQLSAVPNAATETTAANAAASATTVRATAAGALAPAPEAASLKVSARPRGLYAVEAFTRQMHGDSSVCPHPRILPNLVAVCLSAIYRAFSQNKDLKAEDLSSNHPDVSCFVRILATLAEFEDWRLPLSQILQPIPFPSRFLEGEAQVHFAASLAPVVRELAKDSRCEVHQCLVGVRQNKNGWLQVFAASHDSEMYSIMCHALLKCNCLRKAFLSDTFSCSWALEPLILSSLRHQAVAVQCIAILLENHLIKGNDDLRSSAEASLQASPQGQRLFDAIQAKKQMYMKSSCDQAALSRTKSSLGTVTLPPKSNDSDLHLLLTNLSRLHDLTRVQTLSLAFTEITDRSVESITQLRGLKKLNLWATKISDVGLEALCYQLTELEELNLCETAVGARGVEALTYLQKLRVVNLNSTRVTMDAYCKLKDRFPEMEICDVRYTDAW